MTFGSLAVLLISRLGLAILPISRLDLAVLLIIRMMPAVLPISRLIPVLCFLVLKQEGGQPVGVDRARIYKAGEFYSGGYIAHCACVVPPLSL